jgi:hypothetical protein
MKATGVVIDRCAEVWMFVHRAVTKPGEDSQHLPVKRLGLRVFILSAVERSQGCQSVRVLPYPAAGLASSTSIKVSDIAVQIFVAREGSNKKSYFTKIGSEAQATFLNDLLRANVPALNRSSGRIARMVKGDESIATSHRASKAITQAEAITGSFNDGFSVKHGFLRASDGTVTTFDVPGAGTGFNQGTVPLGINPAGAIMGLYIDAKYRHHGFFFLPRR